MSHNTAEVAVGAAVLAAALAFGLYMAQVAGTSLGGSGRIS